MSGWRAGDRVKSVVCARGDSDIFMRGAKIRQSVQSVAAIIILVSVYFRDNTHTCTRARGFVDRAPVRVWIIIQCTATNVSRAQL